MAFNGHKVHNVRPTSNPTGFYENTILDNIKEAAPVGLIQALYLSGFSILVILISPFVIKWYRDRGTRKLKEKRKELQMLIYEQNKRELSQEDRCKRECIRKAFRDQYGSDIDVYGDCRHIPLNFLPIPRVRSLNTSVVAPKMATNESATTNHWIGNISRGFNDAFYHMSRNVVNVKENVDDKGVHFESAAKIEVKTRDHIDIGDNNDYSEIFHFHEIYSYR